MKMAAARTMVPCILFAGVISLMVSIDQSAAAPSAAPDPAVYSLLEKFHGHVCAGSLFGARLGLAAKKALKAARKRLDQEIEKIFGCLRTAPTADVVTVAVISKR